MFDSKSPVVKIVGYIIIGFFGLIIIISFGMPDFISRMGLDESIVASVNGEKVHRLDYLRYRDNRFRHLKNQKDADDMILNYYIGDVLILQKAKELGFDVSDDKRVYFFPIGSGGDRNPGIFAEDIIGRREINFDAIAKASFVLSNAVDLTATLGWSINDRKYRRNSGQINGFLVNTRKETTSLNTAAENTEFENFKTFRRSNRGYGILGFDIFDI